MTELNALPHLNKIYIKKFYNGNVPQELLDLRRAVYCEETSFLSENQLMSANDYHGVHLCVYSFETNELVAAAHVLKAEESDFSDHSQVSSNELKTCIYGSRHIVAKEWRGQGLFSLLLYLNMREGRMWGRSSLIAYQNEGEIAVNKIIQMKPMSHVAVRRVSGNGNHQYNVLPCGQDISYGMYLAWNKMPQWIKEFAADQLIHDEVERTVANRLETFYDNPWFNGVAKRTLTQNQYIEMLGDWHNFVRWTTRLLAKVVGITDNKELRSNFISHMNGEIDHEVMIESDLRKLGGDVEYVKKYMAPGKPIQLFMGLQESLAAFRQNPVLFLAVPYSIEGISANISATIIENLQACIKSWGIDNPRKASTFLSSHVQTDGGDDGHWVQSLKMIKKYLRTEPELQHFLVISHLVFDTIYDSFANAISKPDFQQFKPGAMGEIPVGVFTSGMKVPTSELRN